jgi:hypothetical protein
VVSNLLWALVVDELLGQLNSNDYYTAGHGKDVAILITENFLVLCQRSDKQL